ncbi:HAD-IIIC family phosphatase (plasmid) [Methylobacterium currus]|uniref:HAD-IIIC family phosphatase n=1 Tax=Methylobacterium currus TaxID=2051553 RepID=A0A2R4WWZ7_9HYPH|nr:HAD-IIIC family phosphatase [Methylobacterium currus]AWB26056.1 HAD-IIIC family phosphatase [Methylobacterium currus]
MKRLVMDLDGTITREDPTIDYADKVPDPEIVARMREYRDMGFAIVIYSARNMRTFENSVGKITAHTVPVIIDWLKRHDIPYDEIHVGKPWCGTDGFYVDDRAVRPSEFVSLTREQILALIGPTSAV